MPSYIACGTELVPPARAPHIVYVKTLYRIAGQGYCRHHSARRPQVYHGTGADGDERLIGQRRDDHNVKIITQYVVATPGADLDAGTGAG